MQFHWACITACKNFFFFLLTLQRLLNLNFIAPIMPDLSLSLSLLPVRLHQNEHLAAPKAPLVEHQISPTFARFRRLTTAEW